MGYLDKSPLHWFWIENKVFLILGAILVSLVAFGLFMSFQPYCTTFSDQRTMCSQVVWGGKVYWWQ